MIQFVCDNCSAMKDPGEVWIAGLAAEAVGAVSARREITIQSAWTRTTALHPLSVHFCSTQCKDEYMARLFAPEAPVKEVFVQQSVPSAVERVPPHRKRVLAKAKTERRKSAA